MAAWLPQDNIPKFNKPVTGVGSVGDLVMLVLEIARESRHVCGFVSLGTCGVTLSAQRLSDL